MNAEERREKRRDAREAHKIWVPGEGSRALADLVGEAVRKNGQEEQIRRWPTLGQSGDVIAELTETART